MAPETAAPLALVHPAKNNAVCGGVLLDAGDPPGSKDGGDVGAPGEDLRQRGLRRRGADPGSNRLHLVIVDGASLAAAGLQDLSSTR